MKLSPFKIIQFFILNFDYKLANIQFQTLYGRQI